MSFSCLRYADNVANTHTTFLQSIRRSFLVKLFLDELPTVEKLTRRKPDVYNDVSWQTCLKCAGPKEDITHLFLCPVDSITETQKLIVWAINSCGITLNISHPSQNYNSLLRLKCWSVTNSPYNFIWLCRGMVSVELNEFFRRHSASSDQATKALQLFMYELRMKFHSEIWIPRCDQIIAHEQHVRIDTISKKSRSKSHSIAVKRSKLTFGRFKSWISDSIKAGSSWKGFRMVLDMYVVRCLRAF
jgi:hypothetical protein